MCENLLNILREIPELLKESEGPFTIKRASHEVKGKRKAPQCLLERGKCCDSACSNFDQSKFAVNK